jgi:hypothetical protein
LPRTTEPKIPSLRYVVLAAACIRGFGADARPISIPFIGDLGWRLDYTVASIGGEPSSMALAARAVYADEPCLFTIAHKLFWRPRLSMHISFSSSLSLPSAARNCRVLGAGPDLHRSRESATCGMLVALSPMMVIYGGQVMTDVPSVFLSRRRWHSLASDCRRQGSALVFAGAIVLGLAVNMRETAALFFLVGFRAVCCRLET